MAPSRSSSSGFTLLELLMALVVIAIIGVILFIAVNPAAKNEEAHNAQRRGDVVAILTGVYQYALTHGSIPAEIPTGTPKEICVVNAPSCQNGVKLDALVSADFPAVPVDPLATGTGTLYTIVKQSNGQLTVAAPGAENAVITFTR